MASVNVVEEVQREMRIIDTIRDAKELTRKLRDEDFVRLDNLLTTLENQLEEVEKRQECIDGQDIEHTRRD